jgi:hypothetical protein
VLSRLTREHCALQLYVHACSSAPAHPNVCRLLGWGIQGKGPTLKGLAVGDQVYMVQEFAGEELQKNIDGGATVAPDLAYNYLTQLATGMQLVAEASLLLCDPPAHCIVLLSLCVPRQMALYVYRLGASAPEEVLPPRPQARERSCVRRQRRQADRLWQQHVCRWWNHGLGHGG